MRAEVIILLVALAAYVFGFLMGHFTYPKYVVGNFIINHALRDKDLCTLELQQDLEYIESHKYMTLNIKLIK